MPTLNLGRVRFNHRGAYNPASSYLKHDTVTDDGQTYAATQDVTPTDPGPNDVGGAAFWAGMLLRGADYNAARDRALQAADDAQESATLAGTRANDAQGAAAESAASMEMAERWASEEEDVEVSPGQFSAYHWARKAQSFGDPNEFQITADQTEDTRTLSLWMAQALANQQQANENAEALANLGEAASRGVVGGPGDLMSEGAFGLGGNAIALADNETITATGFFLTDALSERYPLKNSVLLNMQRITGPKRSAQILIATSQAQPQQRAFFRGGDTDTEDTPWQEIYHNANILGTVSQSGGVPTGAIIERGSNDFGEWSVWANGYCEVINNNLTLIETSSNRYSFSWSFGKTFISAAHVDITVSMTSPVWDDVSSRNRISALAATGSKLSSANLELYVIAGYSVPAGSEIRQVTAKASGYLW